MSICRECAFYIAIDESEGNCKCKRIERHVIPMENHSGAKEVVNGWPVTNGDNATCGDFASG